MKYIKLLGLSILGIFAPIKPMLLAAFSLAILDLILGIMAAKKQGQRITSAGLKRTVGKIFLYELAIMVSYVGETYLLNDWLPISRIMCAFIGSVELKSIFENLDIINGSPIFATIISKLVSSEEKKLK